MMTAVAYVTTRAIPIDATAGGAAAAAEPPTLRVAIDAAGRIYADGDPVTYAELRSRAAELARVPLARAVLAADPAASHDAFVGALDVVTRLAAAQRGETARAEPFGAIETDVGALFGDDPSR